MYAGGAEHPHRPACRAIMEAVAGGSLDAVTSTEVIQEILHRFSRGRREVGRSMAASVLSLFDEILPVDRGVIAETVSLFGDHPGLSARDAIHVATCRLAGISKLVSLDTDFDAVPEIERLSPLEALKPGR